MREDYADIALPIGPPQIRVSSRGLTALPRAGGRESSLRSSTDSPVLGRRPRYEMQGTPKYSCPP